MSTLGFKKIGQLLGCKSRLSRLNTEPYLHTHKYLCNCGLLDNQTQKDSLGPFKDMCGELFGLHFKHLANYTLSITASNGLLKTHSNYIIHLLHPRYVMIECTKPMKQLIQLAIKRWTHLVRYPLRFVLQLC